MDFPAVPGDEAPRQVPLSQPGAVELLDGVLLDEQPLVAGIPQRLHVRVAHVRVVRQVHLRRRESAHPAHRLPSEERREMVLPGPDLELDVRDRRRRDDRMAPAGPQPFDGRPVPVVERDRFQVVQDIAPPHLAESEEQLPGVVEHDARPLAAVHQSADEVGDARVAGRVHRRVVVPVDVLPIHHVLEVADHGRGAEVALVQHDRLVHVKRDGEPRLDLVGPEGAPRKIGGIPSRGRLAKRFLPAADVGQALDRVRNRVEQGLAHSAPQD